VANSQNYRENAYGIIWFCFDFHSSASDSSH